MRRKKNKMIKLKLGDLDNKELKFIPTKIDSLDEYLKRIDFIMEYEIIQTFDNNYKYRMIKDNDKDLMWYYGVNSDFTTARMDRWNMSTHLVNFKHDIPPERITLLLSSDGHDDALSILVEIYTKYRNSTGKIDDLDKFMDYLFNKSKDKLYLFEKK